MTVRANCVEFVENFANKNIRVNARHLSHTTCAITNEILRNDQTDDQRTWRMYISMFYNLFWSTQLNNNFMRNDIHTYDRNKYS